MSRPPLVPCTSCGRHVRGAESDCPFCKRGRTHAVGGIILGASLALAACHRDQTESPSTMAPSPPPADPQITPTPPAPAPIVEPTPIPVAPVVPSPAPPPIRPLPRYGLARPPTPPPPTTPRPMTTRYGISRPMPGGDPMLKPTNRTR